MGHSSAAGAAGAATLRNPRELSFAYTAAVSSFLGAELASSSAAEQVDRDH